MDESVELIRANDAYHNLFGHNDMMVKNLSNIYLMSEEHKINIINTFNSCAKTEKTAECEFVRECLEEKPIWMHLSLKYLSKIEEKYILIGTLSDITLEKELDFELQN